MKIAVLARIVNTKSGSRAAIELARSLAKNNQVVFLAQRKKIDHKVKKKLEKEGVKIILVKNWIKLPKILKKERFDIISSHAPLLPTLLARLSGIPVVSTYYGTQLDAYYERLLPHQKPSPRDKILNWLGNRATLFLMGLRLTLAHQIIAISQYTADEAKRLYGKKVPYIYLGVDSESLKPKPSKKGRQSTNLLSVSRFTPYKGFHVLIEVFKKLEKEFPGLKLTLVGSSSQENYLSYLRKIKDKDIRILTNISDEELAKEYQKSNIYLSWDRFLFFGLPVLEAALSGKPAIVLSRCAAPETIIQGKTGYLVKNEPELLDSLEKLIKDKKLREVMGLNAQRLAENFNWEVCGQKYEQFLKRSKKESKRD